MADRTIVVVTAGLTQPSSTRLLADRLGATTEASLVTAGLTPHLEVVELRDHAQDLVNHLLAGFPSPALRATLDQVLAADGLIAVSPIFNASYSGLFKLFFDVLERGSLGGVPVILGATGGTVRHSLAIDHAFRPLFAYLGAAVVPTAVFAASEDWGAGGSGDAFDGALADRLATAGAELAAAVAAREPRVVADPFADPVPFEDLLRRG
jgi:FMN reductase